MNAHTALTRKEIPAHVDPAHVVDFDMFHDHRYSSPAARMRRCRGWPRRTGGASCGRRTTAGTG